MPSLKLLMAVWVGLIAALLSIQTQAQNACFEINGKMYCLPQPTFCLSSDCNPDPAAGDTFGMDIPSTFPSTGFGVEIEGFDETIASEICPEGLYHSCGDDKICCGTEPPGPLSPFGAPPPNTSSSATGLLPVDIWQPLRTSPLVTAEVSFPCSCGPDEPHFNRPFGDNKRLVCCGTKTVPPPCPFENCDPPEEGEDDSGELKFSQLFGGGLVIPALPGMRDFDGAALPLTALPEDTAAGLTATTVDPTYASAVSLNTASGEQLCSGVLVGSHYVLTAAHCTCHEGKASTEHLSEVVYGTGKVSDRNYFFPIEQAEIYDPEFCALDESERRDRPDLAIVTFKSERPIARERLARLFSDENWSEPTPATLAGFGASEKKDRGIKRIWPYTSVTRCTEENRHDVPCDPGIDLHAPVGEGKVGGGCDGDSGGPLYDRTGRIAAIARSGVERVHNNLCGSGDVLTHLGSTDKRMAGFRNWIEEILNGTQP